ncbi:MAG: hypothetical protein HC914_12380 [Chloroflexaceae bacterium]|nr:hypothetical protein [Chloroflexaceae bacterium]
MARTITLIGFILLEYIRSGRIWIEIGAMLACYIALLRGEPVIGVEPEHFFLTSGLFLLGLTIYTVSTVVSLGDRIQGYLILSRRVGRVGYLLGLYGSAIVILVTMYITLALITSLFSGIAGLGLNGWVLGTLPLLLNVGLLAALLLMLSPLVFATGWRLLVLFLIALAFSSNFLGSATVETLNPTIQSLLRGVQTILSWPLVPAFSGFALSLSRDYSGSAPVILVAQVSLLVALLSLAIYAFSHRELMLSTEG